MKECSKSITRRLHNPNFINHYFVGSGVDIGGRPDPLVLYRELFSKMQDVKTWDIEDGDAQYMAEIPDEYFDFVHSSHCLEHLVDPKEGLVNWLRILKPGGYLIVTVPDEDMYEQGTFPSDFNADHKWTFTIYKNESWSEKSINILEMAKEVANVGELVRIELLTATYRYNIPRFDQTLTPIAESGIEFIIRKKTSDEIDKRGRWVRTGRQPTSEIRIHFNQYRNDVEEMKRGNTTNPPFKDDNEL